MTAHDATFSQVFGNTRLMLITDGINDDVVMSLWYSRASRSIQDLGAFFAFSPEEKRNSRPSHAYDPMIAEEIHCLQPLPAPLALAYELCKAAGVSHKYRLLAVRHRGEYGPQPITEVIAGELRLPTVLIGGAAHAIPTTFSRGDINDAIYDALDLCRMIVERYHNDELFARLPEDYYHWRSRRWQDLRREWEERWFTAHGLPYDSFFARKWWVGSRLDVRNSLPAVREEKDFESLQGEEKSTTSRDHQREGMERWRKVEHKLNERLKRKPAAGVPPGVVPSKIVLRYIDSTHPLV